MKTFRWIVLLALALGFNVAAFAEDDTCKKDGGDAYCFAPEIGPYWFQVTDGNVVVTTGYSEAGAISDYEAAYTAAYSPYGICSVTLTDNRPSIPPPSIGTGSVEYGDYGTALFGGVGQYLQASWKLSIDQQAMQIPLVMHAVYGNACEYVNHHGVYVYRYREVTCPGFPIYSLPNWSGIPESYCYRTPPARDPDKNFCEQCPKAGNPVNIGTGNKYQVEEDYAGGGATPLRFIRYYNNQLWTGSSIPSPEWKRSRLGINWRGHYDRYIRFSNSVAIPTVYAYRHDGRTLHFRQFGGGFKADDDIEDRVLPLTNGAGVITGWRYIIASTQEVETYDAAGQLLSIRTRGGLTQTMAYSNGRLASVADDFGATLSFTYDANDALQSVTDPSGHTYSYTYDYVGNVESVTYPDGSSRTYIYGHIAGEDANTGGAFRAFAMTGIRDESANRFATFKYNSSEYAISTEHAGGVETYLLDYPLVTSTSVTDPLGQLRVYEFAMIHNMPRVVGVTETCNTPGCTDPVSSTSYDVNGNVSSRSDFKGNVTTYSYDLGRNLETSRTEAYGTPRARTVTTQWHASYRLPAQIDEPGKRTTFTRDAAGNVLTRTELDTATSASRTWTYTYNSYGQVLTANGPRTDVSDVTTYTYYNCTIGYHCGQVHTVTNAAGHVTTYNTYNAHGQPLTMTDPNGVVTTLTYDLRQRVTSRTVGTEVTTFEYWPTGLLKKATLPDASYLSYTYDAAHRLTEIADAEGNHIVYTLDNMGNRTQEDVLDPSSALTQTRSRVFDTLNRLQQEIGAAGTANVTTTFGYDNNGNQTSIAAPLGRDATQDYDELNRLTGITDPLSGATQYGYNALDQLISVTDPRSKVTSYAYNALGDLTQQVSPDAGTTTNTYDSGGNLLTSTDARSKTATYSYDALNRVTGLSYTDQAITYTYDSGSNQKGRLTQVTDNSGSTSWTYDPQGRVLSKQQSMGITKSVGYGYDSSGRLQTLTLPSSNTVTYGYTDGKVTSLTLNGSTTILSNVLYQPFGPSRGWTWGNSTLAIREYDTDGLITDIDSAGLKTYEYDDAFRITDINDASNTALSQSYGYDLLDRLTTATGTGLNQSWTYDANGNRLTQGGGSASTYTVSSSSNRLTGVSGSLSRGYTYDNAGNTTNDGSATFVYNDAGRMVSATKAGTTTTYAINALGQRVKKTTGGTSRYFVYDEAGHLLGEYNNSGVLIQETIWLGDTPVATIRPNGGGVSLFYVHADHLNAPRRVTRSSDNVVVWRWDADPFGTTAANEDPDGDSGVFAYGLRFPGQYRDQETGLDYNYFRDYDPATGRYVQSDPIGLRGGLNTYAYAANSPTTLVDALGLDPHAEPYPTIPPLWPYQPGSDLTRDTANAIIDFVNDAGRLIRDVCTGDALSGCRRRYDQEAQRCDRYLGRGPRDDPNRWHRACIARAADRMRHCRANDGPAPDEPGEYGDDDIPRDFPRR